jgi:hypothetical protein
MRISAAAALAAVWIAIGSVGGFLVTRQLLPASRNGRVQLFYSQQRFSRPRIIKARGFALQSMRLQSDGGPVEVDWYDSALMSLGSSAGAYVTLYVDGRAVESSLRGELRARDEADSATLGWEGLLSRGAHTVVVRLDRVDSGFAAPYVPVGYPGIDNLIVTQYSTKR